jgi:hypothetical protein
VPKGTIKTTILKRVINNPARDKIWVGNN